MKKLLYVFPVVLIVFLSTGEALSQKPLSGPATIKASDLESHVSFLGSTLLKGRLNGSPELEIAASYLAAQAKKIGLKPVSGNSYYYPYTVTKKSLDPEKTFISINSEGKEPVVIREQIYQYNPFGPSDFELEGEVIFAGYGIKVDKYNFNDFDTLNIAGKIVLVMNRAPLTAEGKCKFEDQSWLGRRGLFMKLMEMGSRKPKAILLVSDPKSGFLSMDLAFPESMEDLKSTMYLKGKNSRSFDFKEMPTIVLVHTRVADELLNGTGKTLAGLQDEIDSDMKSHSFLISGKTLKIREVSMVTEKQFPNVAGIVEGSDPVLKNEVVIFSGHMDHVGGEGENIKPGADDDASGCAAILELAEAFQSLPRKPLRSVMFLWVSGEEVGLFGSEAYIANPVFPLDKTVADLNMDMIGRVRNASDTLKNRPVSAPDEVFVITDDQSTELVSIADAAGKKTNLRLDYSLSGKNHPERLFTRSDHFNFVKKDIPVLFFTTGLHSDYHKTGDVIEKINFKNMEQITRTVYEIGYQVANKKSRVVVDKPFSKWENNPFLRF